MASNLIYGSLLTANGSLKILNLSSIGGVVLNLLLNYWLIQDAHEEMGALAAAKVAAITQLTVAFIQRFYCYRLFKIRLPKSLILRFLGLLFMLILFYVGVWVVLFSRSISMSSSSVIVSYAIVSIALMFLFGFIDLKEIRKLLQKREAMK
jgi:O-antigen/teichoic acid export membrane protein